MGRRDHDVPRVWPRASRSQLKRYLLRRCQERPWRATTLSFLRSCSSIGSLHPKFCNALLFTIRPGSRFRRRLVEESSVAATFNEGFITVEYLSAALVDMKLHLAGDKKIDADAFERRRWLSWECRTRL